MANGHPGKKIPEQVKLRAIELLGKGLKVDQVATRLSVSKSVIRNWQREQREQAGSGNE